MLSTWPGNIEGCQKAGFDLELGARLCLTVLLFEVSCKPKWRRVVLCVDFTNPDYFTHLGQLLVDRGVRIMKFYCNCFFIS